MLRRGARQKMRIVEWHTNSPRDDRECSATHTTIAGQWIVVEGDGRRKETTDFYPSTGKNVAPTTTTRSPLAVKCFTVLYRKRRIAETKARGSEARFKGDLLEQFGYTNSFCAFSPAIGYVSCAKSDLFCEWVRRDMKDFYQCKNIFIVLRIDKEWFHIKKCCECATRQDTARKL